MSDRTWLDLSGAHLLPADDLDVAAPWLRDGDEPPREENESREPSLRSPDAPPAHHPGALLSAGLDCPEMRHWSRDRPPCGGLPGDVAERAQAYQDASIRDPQHWTAETAANSLRPMRSPSAMGIYRVLAHFARPSPSPGEREALLRGVLRPVNGDPSPLQAWHEGSDFMANGLLRLLYLFAPVTVAPDASRPDIVQPLIPCDLQNEAVEQLLGWKYFGDEPARHPLAPAHDEVYWSENHQLLFATAEYLAGQLLPHREFTPTVYTMTGGQRVRHSDPAWSMSADDRMARAYPRLVRWLDHRLMFGLSEWVSPVYFDYDIAGLLNLVDFCDDRAVADKAAIVLDIALLELARFAGHGHGPGTAGRAYPSHKFTGWGASVGDTLQILFDHWDVEQRAEDVLEDWRLQAEEEAHPGVPQERRASPTSKVWSVADSVGAHSLATSQRYCIPTVVFGYAYAGESPGRFERSRVSIDFDEGLRDHGIGFSGQADVLDWWSRGGFGAPATIVGSRDLADAWDAEGVSPFKSMPGLFLLDDATLVAASEALAVEALGSCLTTANLCLWREGAAALSSVQKFRVGQVGRQAQIWQASLGPYITVWSTYPAAEPAGDTDGPNWWGGNAAQPRVVQRDGALICVHDSNLFAYTHLQYGYRSHAWFPVQLFHEALEVRRPDPDDDDNVIITDLHSGAGRREPFGLSAERGGVWWFGRWKDSYIGLFSAKDSSQLLRTGRWADREILCEDRVNVLVCQVGSRLRFGSFSQFVQACSTARIHVGLGVYQPSNPLVDIQCSYDVPGPDGRRLSLNLEERWPAWHGEPFRDEGFPRWETPWTRVLWGQRDYILRGADPSGALLDLHHDCTNGTRTGTGL